MNFNLQSARVVAPVTSVEEARRVIDAGADALYCGAMFDEWVELFGDADVVSRRQGRPSHISNRNELRQVARIASDRRRDIALTLNVRYSHLQQEKILDLIALWEDAGGTGLLVCDPGLLFLLERQQCSLKRHLSIMAGVFNRGAVRLFQRLGVSRVVLPREFRLEEVKDLTSEVPEMEFEMLTMMQKCQFIDGMCGFYHGVRLPSDPPGLSEINPSSLSHAAAAMDPQYEGHGCQLDYWTRMGPVVHLHVNDDQAPHCAACLLPDLYEAGAHFFKIAGRGFPTDQIVRVVRFLSASIEIWRSSNSRNDGETKIRELYLREFGWDCRKRKCYYD